MKQLGKYEIFEILGAGATSEVYRARDIYLDREVALKVLKVSLVADNNSFQRFALEAKSAAGLYHPNIVTTLDMGESEGRYFIAMRYIDGRSLDKILQEDGPLTWDEALLMAQQIAAALDYAHGQGFLHRDVKPSNILRTQDGQYLLADFGLVHAMMSTGLTSHTGAVLGTPPYIAPEMWHGKKAIPATDQYALACVIYEALTGCLLFHGDTPPVIMMSHFSPADFSVAPRFGVSKGAIQIFEKALAEDHSKRYQNNSAFVASLAQASSQANMLESAPVAPAVKQPDRQSTKTSLSASQPNRPARQTDPDVEPGKKSSKKFSPFVWLTGIIVLLCICSILGVGMRNFFSTPAVVLEPTSEPAVIVITATTVTNTSNEVVEPTPTETKKPTKIVVPTPTTSETETPTATAEPVTAPESFIYWEGKYYTNRNFEGPPAYTRQDAEINFDWGDANPAPGIGKDNFSIRWTKCMVLEEGTYLFRARSDDGMKVWLDNDQFIDISNRQVEQNVSISSGNHCIKIEYNEVGGLANAYFTYEFLGLTFLPSFPVRLI